MLINYQRQLPRSSPGEDTASDYVRPKEVVDADEALFAAMIQGAVVADTFPWSPLQFNAWNTLPEMRPLGQVFRARKHVHKAHSEARLHHIYDAQPGAMVDKAPFATG